MRENQTTETTVRLNKFLSEAGVCSRREADRLIESGKVTVDGRRAEMGNACQSFPESVCRQERSAAEKLRWCCLRSTSRLESSAQKKKMKKPNIIRF